MNNREILVQEKFLQYCELWNKENPEFIINPSDITVRIDLKGRSAGTASWMPRSEEKNYTIRLNVKMFEEKYNSHIMNETLPHELAHIIGYMFPELGAKNHNGAWREIFISLGGKGERCHSLGLGSSREMREFLYSDGVNKHIISAVRHNRIWRQNTTYRVKFSNGSTLILCQDNFVREA